MKISAVLILVGGLLGLASARQVRKAHHVTGHDADHHATEYVHHSAGGKRSIQFALFLLLALLAPRVDTWSVTT